MSAEVDGVFAGYPAEYRAPLLCLRELIRAVADEHPEVGALDEGLRWGQPTYSTLETKSGSPIRLGRFGEDGVALFFHCQTSLVESFRALFGDVLAFSKNRAIVLDAREELPMDELAVCIELALTYHSRKSK